MDIEAGETPLASSREAEIEKLKADLARLQRQLQAEKADNTGNLREYRKQRESCGNRDNDETSLPIKQEPRSSQHPTVTNARAKPVYSPRQTSEEGPAGSDFEASSSEQSSVSDDEPTAPPIQNRKRSRAERMKDELADLNLLSFDLPSGKRRKRRCSTRATTQSDGNFAFKAVHAYSAKGLVVLSQASVNESALLKDRVRRAVETWEHNKGLEWQFEFTKARYKPKIPPCVTSRLGGRRTKWRHDGVAKYACAYCVKSGRPCFTWVEKQLWIAEAAPETEDDEFGGREFRMLPIHEVDRRHEYKNIASIWTDHRAEFQDSDVVKRDEWDEDYSESSE